MGSRRECDGGGNLTVCAWSSKRYGRKTVAALLAATPPAASAGTASPADSQTASELTVDAQAKHKQQGSQPRHKTTPVKEAKEIPLLKLPDLPTKKDPVLTW